MIDIRRHEPAGPRELLQQYGIDIDVTAQLDAFRSPSSRSVAIARAVDLSGKVLILDEPTASLDAQEVAMLFASCAT
jgi:monosaccharide-transporting ATPase